MLVYWYVKSKDIYSLRYIHISIMATAKVLLSIDENVLKEFDDLIGLVKRSTYVNEMMKKEIEKKRIGYEQ